MLNFKFYVYFNYERKVQNGSNPLYFLPAKATYIEIQICMKSSEDISPALQAARNKMF